MIKMGLFALVVHGAAVVQTSGQEYQALEKRSSGHNPPRLHSNTKSLVPTERPSPPPRNSIWNSNRNVRQSVSFSAPAGQRPLRESASRQEGTQPIASSQPAVTSFFDFPISDSSPMLPRTPAPNMFPIMPAVGTSQQEERRYNQEVGFRLPEPSLAQSDWPTTFSASFRSRLVNLNSRPSAIRQSPTRQNSNINPTTSAASTNAPIQTLSSDIEEEDYLKRLRLE